MDVDNEIKELNERKELIEQLNKDSNWFIRSTRNVTDVNGFNRCDIELLKKFRNSYEECCNVLDEIFTNASTVKEKL